MRYTRCLPDPDPGLTAEWLEPLAAMAEELGPSRTRLLLSHLLDRAGELDVGLPPLVSTPYVNSIPPGDEPAYPGDLHIEGRIQAFVQWNAAAMVLRANAAADGVGGHLSTYASAAELYEVGFNHFFRGGDGGPGDQVFFQGHSSPGIYARAYVEGRLGNDDLDGFRQETGRAGLSSYPHPRLMPDFWQFPTVSMGIGPINAVYQARFNRYLLHRGIADTSGSRVWCFLGDGECDEPESLAGLSLAAYEGLDNLTFVVNCNLQRLDGPVRGNGKVIQTLEAQFRGAGWNVLKVIWGGEWDPLLASTAGPALVDRFDAMVDGQFQKCSVDADHIRACLGGGDPGLEALLDGEGRHLPADLHRGGHDRQKIHAAYRAACEHRGAPTVVLAKTVKGRNLGPELEGRNATHQIKKMKAAQLVALRDRLGLTDDIDDAELAGGLPPYRRPDAGSPERAYLTDRRRDLGGPLPRRRVRAAALPAPGEAAFADLLGGSGGRAVSTTMGFAALLRNLVRDPDVGRRVVPIVPDEARTFGMDALFSEVGIYTSLGQRYEPVDAGMQLSYRESTEGQLLEEGITEAGAMASFTAAGTSYATWGEAMIPFYVFYSMFGFQRTGDLTWALGDVRGRGFLLGATAGRTTLHGEGLQHQDGHSLLLASTFPNLQAYDPAFAFEVAVIIRDGLARMYGEGAEDVFYYLTLYNENYPMPPMPPGAAEGIVRGIYRFATAPQPRARRAAILFSGTAQGAAREAQHLLARDHDVAVDLWSVTSYKALREEALDVERWNRLHPTRPRRVPHVTSALAVHDGPFVAVTDFMKAVPDQISRWVPGHFTSLGTDGYGRSGTRTSLRRHFETDAAHLVVAVLNALADMGEGKAEEAADAVAAYGIDCDAVAPRTA